MESYGYCTRNDQGMFEVSWSTENTFWTKLFKKQTKFKFMTKDLNKDSWHLWTYKYLCCSWVDSGGVVLTDEKALRKLSEALKLMAFEKVYFDLCEEK